MELNQLETFLAVAEEKSFSRAAVRLHRTQPAVSQVIRKLEESVGETLFDRAARDGSLTASGALLRDYALRLLALRREATSALDNRTQAIVTASLNQLNVTRILVAHRLSTIRQADRIYVVEAGRVVQQGGYDELVAAEGLFARLVQRQSA